MTFRETSHHHHVGSPAHCGPNGKPWTASLAEKPGRNQEGVQEAAFCLQIVWTETSSLAGSETLSGLIVDVSGLSQQRHNCHGRPRKPFPVFFRQAFRFGTT